MSSVGLQPDQKVQSHPASFALSGQRTYLLGLLLIVLSVALYYPVRTHPYVNYDDNVYVTDNVHVKDGLTWDTVTWAFVTNDGGNWHPLTWLSHALDVEMYDLTPGGHHQTSMLLHALNAALLFWVLRRATGYVGRSFMVAALFAVHPVNVESVVWIAERKTVLSMTFFLLALGAWRWYAAKPHVLRYAVVAVLFALGLMAKPQIITFPFVLLLWDYWPLGRLALRPKPSAVRASPFAFRQNGSGEISGEKRTANSEQRPSGTQLPQKSFWALVLEKLPLLAIAAVSAAITMKAQQASGAVLSLGATPLSIRLSNGIVSYVKYLRNAFWPTGLAPMYPHPGDALRAWQVYGALLILLTITLLVVERRRRPYLLVGWLWFLGTLVPMIGLVQVGRQAMADRYAYMPLIGIFIMVCWGVAELTRPSQESGEQQVPRLARLARDDRTGHPKRAVLPAALLPAVSIVVVLVLSIVARRQIGYWSDNVVLWTHTIQATPPNYVAQDNLGGALLAHKRLDDAIAHFREAAAIHPVDPISAFNIGFYDQEHGDFYDAIEQYKKAILLTTSPSVKIQAWNDMGIAYRTLGNTQQAHECFEAAKRLQAQ
ncbi:MAG: tetratricopeptide repeat protein [Candidatus Korobacteraceae bacterium]